MNASGVVFHPDLGQYVEWNAYPLSEDPEEQVSQTITRMRRDSLKDLRSAPIQSHAALVQQSGTGDMLSDSFWFAKNRIDFRQDEQLSRGLQGRLDGPVVEVLIRPRDLAGMPNPQEDCDGFASYLASLVMAQGGKCSFVTVAADPREPGRFSHVYLACADPKTGQRVSLDSSHGPYPGWECTESGQVTRLKEWPIQDMDWGSLILIAAVLYAAARVWGVL